MRGLIRRRVAQVPSQVWLVGAVAALMGTAWATLTPLFQVPDETAHFSYVQYLAETGRMPDGSTDQPAYSSQQELLLQGLGTYGVIGRGNNAVPAADEASRGLLEAAKDAPAGNGGGSTTSSSQPPLYYAVNVPVYLLASPLGPSAQVRAIRMASVVFFAITAMLCALLVARLFPSYPWMPTVGGLAVAVAPASGFISGGVTPDNLLDLLAVALLLAIVVGLRNPSTKGAVLIALVGSLGALTKLTFVGLLPATALAVLIVCWRLARRDGSREAGKAFLAASGSALAVFGVYCSWAWLQGRGLLPTGASAPTLPAEEIPPYNLREHLSYAWQLYLPRVPGQQDVFGFSPITETWLGGWLGRYGWLDYGAPGWLIQVGTWAAAVVALLAVSALVQHRRTVRRNAAELVCFGTVFVGLAFSIALVGYDYRRTTGFTFEQVRYLFPLLGLYAAAIAAATLGMGDRRAPVLAVVVTSLLTLHGVSGLILTVGRYYGS